jgi:hypothetical protein
VSDNPKQSRDFWLVPASLLVLVMLLEGALRLMGFNPFGEFIASEGRAIFIQPSDNPMRIFEPTPGSSGTGWGTEISINSHGFRGPEIAVKKPAGVKRIAVIGDSITFGNNLPPGHEYPAQLQQLFDDENKNVEVLNLGLGGYDTLQEVATLEEVGLQFSPDVVVLGYCINDIGVASGNLNYVKRLQRYGKNPLFHL